MFVSQGIIAAKYMYKEVVVIIGVQSVYSV